MSVAIVEREAGAQRSKARVDALHAAALVAVRDLAADAALFVVAPATSAAAPAALCGAHAAFAAARRTRPVQRIAVHLCLRVVSLREAPTRTRVHCVGEGCAPFSSARAPS